MSAGHAPKVFISYRRDDTIAIAGRIRDHLSNAFGSDNVYFDIDTIPFGVDFRQHIDKMVAGCDAVLVLIGRRYLDVTDDAGVRRLENPHDFVRLEVEAALRRGIPVVPILVDGATMPNETQLPEGMSELAFRNGIAVRYDPDFHSDMNRLVNGLSPGGVPAATTPATKTAAKPAKPKRAQPVKQAATDRDRSAACVKRAKALLAADAPDDALKEATEAIRLDPSNALAWLYHGMARWEKGARIGSSDADRIEQRKSVKDYDESIRLDPTIGHAYTCRSMVRMINGDLKGSQEDLDMAKRLPFRAV
jgi:tetratricopeptide (TPR) repeat protein